MNALTNGRYNQFSVDVNATFSACVFLKVSIYTLEDASVFVLDSNSNNIDNRLISSISYAYASIDETTGQQINGTLTINFDDGSSIVVHDDVDVFWYQIHGITGSPIALV